MLFGKHVNKFYKRYRYDFLIGTITLIVVDFIQLYVPESLGYIVDFFNNGSVSGHEQEIMKIIVQVILVAFGMFLGRLLWRITILSGGRHIEADLREEMFLKSERLSQRYYHENTIGNILSWMTTDVEVVQEYFGFGTVNIVDAAFLSIFVLIKMFMLDWVISLFLLFPVALIAVWGALVEKWMTIGWETRQKATDELYRFSQENFTGIRVIKAFVKENQQIKQFAKVARKNKEVNVDFAKLSVKFDVAINIIVNLIFFFILGFGSYTVYIASKGEPLVLFNYTTALTPGQVIIFIGYFDALIWPMIAMGQIFTMRGRAKASLKRISAFLDQKEDITDAEDAVEINECKGEIEFKNFSFAYPNQDNKTLDNVSFKIKQGEKIGIVGKIGSGKSTLINMLVRTFNVDDSSIFIDGVDIMKVKVKSLRSQISIVPQDNFLFSDTIKNNISFGNHSASQEDIEKAADFASIDENIKEFEKGYETVSGERGVTLSGGQKQRISIARAYLLDSPILILDDSVSAVDLKTEERILNNIEKYRKNKTTIIVASRVSTVQKMDKIVVLNEGKVEAFDTPENLLKISPTYQKMVYLQKLEAEVEGK